MSANFAASWQFFNVIADGEVLDALADVSAYESGYFYSALIGEIGNFLRPEVTVPASVNLLQGHSDAIPGVAVSEANSLPGETFTVTVSDQEGALTASGADVSRLGGKTLSISGTLAQVNADLATLADTDNVASPNGTFDLITVAVTDSFGNTATESISAKAYSLDPAVTGPASVNLLQGHRDAIPGVTVSEANSLKGETFTATVSDEDGVLTASGADVSGSGKTLTISGTLAQVNADLATLADTDNVASPNGNFDLITVAVKDSFGNTATKSLSATAYSLQPAVTGPASVYLLQGHSDAIPGVTVSEANSLPGETFTVTVSDEEGALTASGADVSGSGKTLTISGTLAQVNADLATLRETDNVASAAGIFDAITFSVTDMFGNQATNYVSATAYALDPVVSSPASLILLQGRSTAISGVAVAEDFNVAGETFTVKVSDEEGLLSASGAGVSGSGGKSLTVTGALAQVNADLATLADTDNVASRAGIFDAIAIAATDSFGNQATSTISVTDYTAFNHILGGGEILLDPQTSGLGGATLDLGAAGATNSAQVLAAVAHFAHFS